MSKFFDPRTRIVHSVTSYAGAVKIPKDIVAASIKVNESRAPVTPRLRRSNACTDLKSLPWFFSTENNRIYVDSLNLDGASNKDLIPIESTITYK